MKIYFINERSVKLGRLWVHHPKFFDYSEESLADLYKYVPGGDKQVKYVKNNIVHYIIRNQVYIKYRPLNWNTENAIKWNEHKDDIIRPDAIFEYNNNLYFLEVDISQTMQVNTVKIEKYKLLKESKRLKVFPVIMYVTIGEYRQKQLRALLEPLKNEVLVYSDLK